MKRKNSDIKIDEILKYLRRTMENYTYISDDTWESLVQISKIKMIKKNDCPCRFGDTARDLMFVVKGLLRAYILDEQGHEYNKNFF